jgi:hypothetical protein
VTAFRRVSKLRQLDDVPAAAPADGQVPAYDLATDTFAWADSGGGAGALVGAALTWSDSGLLAANANVPFDVVVYDTDGFWDAANSQFVIPTGKSGAYLLEWYAVIAADPAIDGGDIQVAGDIFSTPSAILVDGGPPAHNWAATFASVILCNEGDAFHLFGSPHGVASYELFPGEAGTRVSITRLGPLPLVIYP